MNNIVNAIIEIPAGSRNKYEIDKDKDKIKLDRVLYSSMSYPAEYGYIENTLANDGDPLDILVLASEKTFPGCIVPARVVGYLEVIDRGFGDQKVIAVTAVDPRYNHINELEDIPEHQLLEIKNFFATYKVLQNVEVIVQDFYGKEDTLKLIEETRNNYKENKRP